MDQTRSFLQVYRSMIAKKYLLILSILTKLRTRHSRYPLQDGYYWSIVSYRTTLLPRRIDSVSRVVITWLR